jgi:hypothetical protein
MYYNPPGRAVTRVRSIKVKNGTATGLAVRQVAAEGETPIDVSVTKLPFRFTLQLMSYARKLVTA